MFDERDKLIIALIRKLGGEVLVTYKDLLEAGDCDIAMWFDGLGLGTYYTATHRANAPTVSPTVSQPVTPNLLIAALMDYARERDLTFSREYLLRDMADYRVEVTENRQALTTRIRMWARDELPPSAVNPAPPPTPPVQAEATRLPTLEIE